MLVVVFLLESIFQTVSNQHHGKAFYCSSFFQNISPILDDEIRQKDGFKNVNLGNVVSSGYKAASKTLFVNSEDDVLVKKFRLPSFELKVGLHELLGHGSGKLLYPGNHEENLINPLNNKTVEHTYKEGETYNSKFTTIASSYEECKAECVGLYLSSEVSCLGMSDGLGS